MEGFDELAVVCLSQDFRSAAGVIPKGTVATVLQVFDDGRAYQVEFEGPTKRPRLSWHPIWKPNVPSLPDVGQCWIPDAKIRDYLLATETPEGKSGHDFFIRFGF